MIYFRNVELDGAWVAGETYTFEWQYKYSEYGSGGYAYSQIGFCVGAVYATHSYNLTSEPLIVGAQAIVEDITLKNKQEEELYYLFNAPGVNLWSSQLSSIVNNTNDFTDGVWQSITITIPAETPAGTYNLLYVLIKHDADGYPDNEFILMDSEILEVTIAEAEIPVSKETIYNEGEDRTEIYTGTLPCETFDGFITKTGNQPGAG